jgi:hypothetical protein
VVARRLRNMGARAAGRVTTGVVRLAGFTSQDAGRVWCV